MLAFEYGINPNEVLKLTRRQISNLLIGMASRKSGYPDSKETVTIESSATIDDKIKAMNSKRFGK